VLSVIAPAEPPEEPDRPAVSYESDRPRPSMLPIAVSLVVGVLVGFVAGYGLGSRERHIEVGPTLGAGERAEPSVPTTGSDPKEWTEQPVDPGARAERPASPAVPPAVTAPPAAQAPTSAQLTVRSTPPRAAVVINGEWRGRTPLALTDLPFGTYAVRVVEPGFEPQTRQVVLSRSAASRDVSVRLARTRPAPSSPERAEAALGRLFIESRPAGARVFVDGRLIGDTPLRLADVAPGSRAVRIELSGYRTVSSDVQVLAGQEARFAVTLVRSSDR
jgi:hypothetical protein